MKYTSLCATTLILGTLMIGCSNSDDTPPAENTIPSTALETKAAPTEPKQTEETLPVTHSQQPTTPSPSPDRSELAKKSGCFACHAINDKVIGPAWKDIANRYRDDANAKTKLLAKVKKGGGGNWTSVTGGLPMPPYSPRVSNSDLELLVDFVLSL